MYLTPEQKRRLAAHAARRGTSEAELIREGVELVLRDAPVPSLEPVGASSDGGVASDVDAALGRLGFGRR